MRGRKILSSSSSSESSIASLSLSLASFINRMSSSLLPYALTLMVILLCSSPVQSRWCTRLITYTTVKPYVTEAMCNQSYQESCSFFSFSLCTRYEEVPCMVQRNKTLLMYKIIEGCCPGYKLNPINNLTCMRTDDDGGKRNQEQVTSRNNQRAGVTRLPPLSAAEGSSNANVNPFTDDGPAISGAGITDSSGGGEQDRATPDGGTDGNRSDGSLKSLGEEGHDGRVEYYDSHSNGKLLGLTNGAYAGIISCLVLLLCVLILVAVRIHKRRRSAKMKSEAQAVEMESAQNMLPNSNTEAQA